MKLNRLPCLAPPSLAVPRHAPNLYFSNEIKSLSAPRHAQPRLATPSHASPL